MYCSPAWFISAIYRIEGYDRLAIKWWWWAALAVVALMVLLACWRLVVITIMWLQKPTENPKRLYKTLARLHRLTATEKVLLSGLIRKLPTGTPDSILFADPSTWAWQQVEDPNTIAPLEKLYAKIFGFAREDEEI